MKADESADCEVLCIAWQRTGQRNRAFTGLRRQKRIQNTFGTFELVLPLGSHFTVTGNSSLNMILKIDFRI
jgi:hypothetical protein